MLALLGDAAPEGSAIVAFLKAYFDESDRSTAGGCDIFCVAGLAFQRNKADGFIAAWRKMLGPISCFHMKDLAASQGEFRDLSKEERGDFLKEAVSIVNRYRLVAVACSCRVSDFNVLKRIRRFHGFNSPYAVCTHTCMILIGNWLRLQKNPARVAYLFEAGHRHAPDAERLLSRVTEAASIKNSYRYRDHKFLEKTDAVPLQAADLLAWEYAKFQDESAHQFKREPRASYVALRDADRGSFIAAHRDKDDLQLLMDELLLAWHTPEPNV